jgi:hypothetical protein
VILLARVVQFASALLLAYGTSYGPRPGNLVFLAGAALVFLMTAAIYGRERSVLRAIWPAVLGFAILFAMSGFPVLGRPGCETVGGSGVVACATATARVREIGAIALVVGALAVALVDRRRSSVRAA